MFKGKNKPRSSATSSKKGQPKQSSAQMKKLEAEFETKCHNLVETE